MSTISLYRLGAVALMVGAVVAALMTALELVASPYNPHGSELSLNMPVHVAKYVGLAVLLLGLTAVYLRQHWQSGRLGLVGFLGLFFGIALAGMPYNIIELTIDPSLSQQAADEYLEQAYSAANGFSILTTAGFPMLILGIVLFAIATLRARVLPRWTGWISLASLPLGIILMVVGELLLPGVVPHPPTWLLLGLSGYGYAIFMEEHAARAATAALATTREQFGDGQTTPA